MPVALAVQSGKDFRGETRGTPSRVLFLVQRPRTNTVEERGVSWPAVSCHISDR